MTLEDMLRAIVVDAVREQLGLLIDEKVLPAIRDAQGGARSALPDMVSVDEAAKSLNVSPKTIRKLLHDGELTRYKIGRLDRIRVDELLNYLRRAVPSRDKVVDIDARARELLSRAGS